MNDFFDGIIYIYIAPGDATKTGLNACSIDLIYSYGVLEHVSLKVLHDITTESKRVLRKTGIAYHMIGLHDHYVSIQKGLSKVNFLRYPEWLWSFFVYNKIGYHNRLREKQFIDLFKAYDGRIIWKKSDVDQSDIDILKKIKIDKAFRNLSFEELATYRTELAISFGNNKR